ncbi:MAG: lactonase family protein [Opitutus sp.]|nr:lactonase family protein [Opitutus sp.]
MSPFFSLALRFSICGVVLSATAFAAGPPAAKEYSVYFGTYTGPNSKGIYRARLDVATGKLSPAELAVECQDPSFLSVHPNGKFLYAIDERSSPEKTPGRGVSGYAIEARAGALTLLNQQEVGGPGPCHLMVDHEGKALLVANYSGGSVAALPLSADGRIGVATTVTQHTGSSINPARQKEPHAHVIIVSPDNRFTLCADLGLDKVMVYRLDAAKALLTPNTPAFAPVLAGSGPRHLTFHPGGKFVYVINELLCTIAGFRYDAAKGTLSELQTVSTLPPGETVKPGMSTAEIAAHPGGKFIFGSNRGHNSIAVFGVDPATGRLTYVENQPTQGKTPRHFGVDPTGTWLLAENQHSDTVVVFRIDAKSGQLTPTGQSIDVPAPVSAVFVAAK